MVWEPPQAHVCILKSYAYPKKHMELGVIATFLPTESPELLAEVEPYDLATLDERIKALTETRGEGIGKVVNAVRVATTGQGVGPGLYDCLVILGRESCIARIAQTRAMLSES